MMDVNWKLLDETRTEHITRLTKEEWEADFTVRKLEEHETREALSLAWKVFSEYESPDYSPEGTEEFRKCLHDEKYLAGIEYYGAFDSDRLIGTVGIRKDKCHICFFFVDGKYHRLGIGTRLFERIKTEYTGKTITLNSSPYGLPFYQSLGFHETDSEQTVNGIRFTPMVYGVQIDMNTDRIKKTESFMKIELMKLVSYKDNIPRMAEYRIEHSYRVAHIGAKIAEAEGFDTERTIIACLLHDIGYSVDFESKEDYRNHGRYGAKIARPFLLSLGFSDMETEEMCYGIAIHVDDQADFEGERTPLALTVGDADNIDRFDAYRLYEGLHFKDYMNLPLDGQRELVQKTLARLPELRELPCGTKTGEKLWKEKIDYQIGFYRKLMDQIQTSCGF